MRRREFIKAITGGAVAWPAAARAQHATMPVVGFLHSGSAGPSAQQVVGLREGLKDSGYVEGQNLTIEFVWADGYYDRLPKMAADLVRLDVAVLVACGSAQSGLAAESATTTIPVVFVCGGDPVKAGLVPSLGRPSGNVTGVDLYSVGLTQKRLILLRELVGSAATIAVLVNPNVLETAAQIADVQAAARALSQKLVVLKASNEHEIDAAFATLAQAHQPEAALLLGNDVFVGNPHTHLAALATRRKIPAIHSDRAFVADGGLMSYGTDFQRAYREAGLYVGRILRGANPADIPVLLPSRFDLAINLKTAKVLGLEISPTLLALADELIE
jgi:putative tryptophan/tyrosine transport system substrate-binding protein